MKEKTEERVERVERGRREREKKQRTMDVPVPENMGREKKRGQQNRGSSGEEDGV
jgi:hypothetical protein